MMRSILENRPALEREVSRCAEVAGYLWQNGWAERNGGNLTVNITEWIDDGIRRMPRVAGPFGIGLALPHLKGNYFYCKGTNKRMRDLARWPMENGAVIRVLDDGAHYEIVADRPVMPTSELPAHLGVHDYLLAAGSSCRASLHTHPVELVALSHHAPFMEKDVLSGLLWSMIPEARIYCPRGLGIVPYALPGSGRLAEATIRQLGDYDVVLWEKHGVFAVGEDIMEAFDQIDVLNKSARIYMSARAMGFVPAGMTAEETREMSVAFRLPK